jgi:hypothetical protein
MAASHEAEQSGFDALKPIPLTPDAMRAKLAELGIEPTSKLGRHALAGGSLSARDGLYKLEGTADGITAGTCGHCAEVLAGDVLTGTNEYGVAVHWDCLGLTPLEASTRVRKRGVSAVRTQSASGGQQNQPVGSKTFADVYCEMHLDSDHPADDQPMDKSGKTLVDRACDAWLGT